MREEDGVEAETWKIVPRDGYNPRGPDGQGRNRLRIESLGASVRCALRPLTRQAALDLARGMAQFAPWDKFGRCRGRACDNCHRTHDRNEWTPGAVIRESPDGVVWLLVSSESGWSKRGYWYKTWADLAQRNHLPPLVSDRDQLGVFWKMDPAWAAMVNP